VVSVAVGSAVAPGVRGAGEESGVGSARKYVDCSPTFSGRWTDVGVTEPGPAMAFGARKGSFSCGAANGAVGSSVGWLSASTSKPALVRDADEDVSVLDSVEETLAWVVVELATTVVDVSEDGEGAPARQMPAASRMAADSPTITKIVTLRVSGFNGTSTSFGVDSTITTR
jgi:hypothetical protein